MKLTKEFIVKANFISRADAKIRLDEFKRYKNIEPYSDRYPIEKMKSIWPNGKFVTIEGVEFLYGELDGKLTFIFRGTDSLWDWILNFLFSKKKIPYEENGTNKKIKVHYGFFKSYLKVRDSIHTIIRNYQGNEVVFHGHSRGAVIAALGALDAQFNFKTLSVGCFVIGMPRLGNKDFKRSFERRLPDFVRFEYGSDLIPQVPPELFGFVHVNNYIHLGRDRRNGIGTIKDHNGELYLNSLKEELKDGKLYY